MKTCLSLIAALILATGCKTDGEESSTASSTPEAEQSARKGRSGKIDLPTARPRPGDGAARPELRDDRADMTPEERRAMREERREERRAERLERIDADGDGKISEQERKAARSAQMDEMKTRLDTDGDGKLTIKELQESRMARRMPDMTTVDTNNDGEVSNDELRKSMEDMRMNNLGGRRGGRGWGGPERGDGAPPAPGTETKPTP